MARQARKDDNAAQLVAYLDANRGALTGIARRILVSRPDLAEDAVQEAATRALSTSAQYDPARARDTEGFKAWFGTILRNVCCEWVRTICRRPDPVPFSALPEVVVEGVTRAGEPDVLDQATADASNWDLEGVELREYEAGMLLDAFARLSPADRELLEDSYLRGVEEVEIARRQRKTPGAVRSALMTARNRLRLHLEWVLINTRIADGE